MKGRGGSRGESDRSVSQVIGVILLLAIIVILPGTVASFVTGLGQTREPAPQFSKVEEYNRDTDVNGQYLNVTHGSGDIVNTEDLRIVVGGAEVRDASGDVESGAELKPDVSVAAQVGSEWRVSEEVSVNASSFRKPGGGSVGSTEYLDLRNATVRIAWVPENTDRSDVLFRWEGADA